jgi:hypothetical protein
VTAGGLPAVTVLIDKDDHPAWTAAAHAAHAPAIGRLTIDPSPANGAPAALAHDLLYSLGKRLPQGGETYGTWADSQRPAWDAVATWILTHRIGHVVVCRTDRLTTARQKQLLTLQERCGIHLTLLWHRPAGPALGTLLEQTPYRLIDTLPQARAVLDRAEHSPNGTRSAGQQGPTGPASSPDDGQWINSPASPDGVVTDRPKRAGCPGAPELTSTKSGAPPHAKTEPHTSRRPRRPPEHRGTSPPRSSLQRIHPDQLAPVLHYFDFLREQLGITTIFCGTGAREILRAARVKTDNLHEAQQGLSLRAPLIAGPDGKEHKVLPQADPSRLPVTWLDPIPLYSGDQDTWPTILRGFEENLCLHQLSPHALVGEADITAERLWIPVALLQAAAAISPLLVGNPMKPTIESAMSDLGLPPTLLNLQHTRPLI